MKKIYCSNYKTVFQESNYDICFIDKTGTITEVTINIIDFLFIDSSKSLISYN